VSAYRPDFGLRFSVKARRPGDKALARRYWRSTVNARAPWMYRLLIIVGNTLTVIGCMGLLLAASGLINAASFSIGISSGIRVIGSIAITGCLLSAIGYGIVDYH